MSSRGLCKGDCENFKLPKYSGNNKYQNGLLHCITCDIWTDYTNCHLKDGSTATEKSRGLLCDCCNFQVRSKPRSLEQKIHLHNFSTEDVFSFEDIYVNKAVAAEIKKIAALLPEKLDHDGLLDLKKLSNKIPKNSIHILEQNFRISIENFLNLAFDFDKLNPFSIIVLFEFENRKYPSLLTKEIFLSNNEIDESMIDSYFISWSHLLETLGYDPFYRTQILSSKENTRRNKIKHDDQNLRDESYASDSAKLKNLSDDEFDKYFSNYLLSINEKEYFTHVYISEKINLLKKYVQLMPNNSTYSNFESCLSDAS